MTSCLRAWFYLAILRSPVAHGRIVRVDVTRARQMDGVVAAFGGADFDALPKIPLRLAPVEGVARFLQRPIARDKVRFVGEPVAVVVATTPELAEDALELIDIEIDSAVVDWTTASAPSALLFEENENQRHGALYRVRRRYGEGVQRSGLYTSGSFILPSPHRVAHGDTWPRRIVEPGRSSMKNLGLHESPLVQPQGNSGGARAGIGPGFRCSEPTSGRGFGVRGELYPEDFLVPFVAREIGRPVKWIEDRREHLMATNHSREITCDLEIACSREGLILGLRGIVYGDMGAYTRTNGGIVPVRTAQFLIGPYRIPALEFDVAIFVSNKTPVGTYRGPGRFEANFFRERLMDMAANDLGIDAADFRRINLIREDELPYTTGKLVPYEKPFIYDTGDYQAGLERVLEAIGYDRLRDLNGKEIDGRRHGVGLTCFVECSGGGAKENSRVVLENDGTISVHTGCSMIGQGLETALTQLAADTLGIEMDQIRVHNASTEDLNEGFGTFASRVRLKAAMRWSMASRTSSKKLPASPVKSSVAQQTTSNGRTARSRITRVPSCMIYRPWRNTQQRGDGQSRQTAVTSAPISPSATEPTPPMSRWTLAPAPSKSWTIMRSRISAWRSIRWWFMVN